MGLLSGPARLRQYRLALWLLTLRDLRERVAGTALGLVWLVLQPLFLMVVYTFVFGFLLRVRFQAEGSTVTFALYLMAGLMPYTAFQQSVQRGASSLISNRGLVSKASFPPVLLPVVVAASSVVTELIGLGVLILAVVLIKGEVSPWLPLLPLLVGLRFLFSLGVAWAVSVLSVFFRDLGQLLGLLLTVLLFVTPILYPASVVPESWRWVLEINPLHHLVDAYRNVIIEGTAPDPGVWGVALLALALAWLGYLFFERVVERAKDFL